MKKYLPLITLLLAACSSIPELQKPEIKTPAQWDGAATTSASDLSKWWQTFNTPELATLQDKALADNLDLKIALSRVKQSRANARMVHADRLPQADLSGDLSREMSQSSGQKREYSSSASLGMDISYELDLFGGLRAADAAGEADAQAQVFDREALALVVSADVAKGYALILALKGRVHIAENNRDALKKTLKVLQARFDVGSASAIELEQQKTETSNAEARIAGLRADLKIAENALAVLLGEMPQGFKISGRSLGDIAVPDIAPGQPSELLARRPDVRRDEYYLISANANIGAARAAFFPSIDIGLSPSSSWSPIHDPASLALSLAGGLSAPLFQGGRLEADLERSEAQMQEMAETYRRTALTAFQEVEDALAASKAADKRYRAYAAAVTSAGKAYDMSHERFDAGAIDYTTLLESERSLLTAKNNLVDASLERFNAAVDLYKALGGGWKI